MKSLEELISAEEKHVNIRLPHQNAAQKRLEEEQPRVSRGYEMSKQIFDFLFAFSLSAVLILPMVVIACIIMIRDFGNPLFRQERIGKHGVPIYIYKFRSMKKNADKLEEALTPRQLAQYRKDYKLPDDPRLIGYRKEGDGSRCFGAKLRIFSIDELPQILFNICLRRNMSLVGPRPILKEELERYYTPEEQALLLSVKPGLTGYWQAYARNNASYQNHLRQDMELYYVRSRSFRLDLKILLKTVETVLKKRGVS